MLLLLHRKLCNNLLQIIDLLLLLPVADDRIQVEEALLLYLLLFIDFLSDVWLIIINSKIVFVPGTVLVPAPLLPHLFLGAILMVAQQLASTAGGQVRAYLLFRNISPDLSCLELNWRLWAG